MSDYRQKGDYKTSRKVGYAATLKTAPAFSFPKKTERNSDDPGPGPGEYGPSMDFSRKGVVMGSSTRRIEVGPATPSPLDYSPTARGLLKSAPSYSFGTKPAPDHLKNKNPGPGAYDEGRGYNAVRRSGPAISLSFRPDDPGLKEKRPGPQAYSLPPQQWDAAANGATLKFRHAEPGGSMRAFEPGPGEYPIHREQAEGKSFGVSRPQQLIENKSPGHIYNVDDSAVRPHRTAWAMSKEQRDVRSDRGVPGPGTYLHGVVIEHPAGHGELSMNKSAPAHSIACKAQYARDPASPAPGEYGLPNDPMRKSAPAFTFRTKSIPDHLRNKNPGPGAYDEGRGYDAVRHSMPSISLSFRPDESGLRERKPGPQAYSLPAQQWDASNHGVTLKFRHAEHPDIYGPAPHDYADKDFKSIYSTPGREKKGFSFGRRFPPKQRDIVPGPIYRVGCTTLGIAAAVPLEKEPMDRIAVL